MGKIDIIRSYGGTTELLSFLDPLEVLYLQRLNSWMYENGIWRVQTSYRRRAMHFILFPAGDAFRRELLPSAVMVVGGSASMTVASIPIISRASRYSAKKSMLSISVSLFV